LNKLLPLIAFSVLLLVPAGVQNAFAQSQTCTLIDFEGVDTSVLLGTIGDVTFTGIIGSSVDSDAGGNGNFANEPSPETAIIFGSLTAPITLTFANPVSQFNWFYSANAQTEFRFFDSGNGLLATINPPVLAQGIVGGDPTGSFDNWGMASHSEVSNIINKIEMDMATGSVVLDNFEFCIIDSPVVGGMPIPIDSTSLILASAQSFSWMIPVALSVLGIGLFVVSRKSENF